MSIWAVNWAFQLDVPNQTHKLVLLSLANFADDEDEAWPHVETLAKMASVSVRSVFRALAALEAAGLISRTMGLRENAGGGLRKSNSLYRLHVPDEVSRRAGRGEGRPKLLREAPSGSQPDTGVMLAAVADKTPSGSQCDTGVTLADRSDTGGTTNMTPVSGLYKEEPSVEPPSQAPLPPAASSGAGAGDGLAGLGGEVTANDEGTSPVSVGVEESDPGVAPGPVQAPAGQPAVSSSSSSSGPGAAPSPGVGGSPGVVSSEDWDQVRRCLPESMQALDGPGVGLVVPLLRERLDAGWRPSALRAVLAADPLPERVRHLAGLVAHRLGRIPVDAAPPPSRGGSSRVPDPPSVPVSREERDPRSVRAEEARLAAIRCGSPDAGRSRWWWLRREMDAAAACRVVDGEV